MTLEIRFIDSMFKYGVFEPKSKNSIARYFRDRCEAEEAIKRAEDFYLSYVNDYLAISRMAEDYNLSEIQTEQLINLGRCINNNK